jgi:hypothetical protein
MKNPSAAKLVLTRVHLLHLLQFEYFIDRKVLGSEWWHPKGWSMYLPLITSNAQPLLYSPAPHDRSLFLLSPSPLFRAISLPWLTPFRCHKVSAANKLWALQQSVEHVPTRTMCISLSRLNCPRGALKLPTLGQYDAASNSIGIMECHTALRNPWAADEGTKWDTVHYTLNYLEKKYIGLQHISISCNDMHGR